MSLSFFGDKTVVPNEDALTAALSESASFWDGVKNHVATACGDMSEEWKFYNKKAGWSFVVKSGKRTILYLIPQETFFKASFTFGEKAVSAALDAGLPTSIVALITEATVYAEGRSFMFDIKTEADVEAVRLLIDIKQQN